MKPSVKFAILVTVIVGTLAWLAAGGVNETKTYYKTISEIPAMGDRAMQERIRVGGDVEQGSIRRNGGQVRFTLTCVAKNGACEMPGEGSTSPAGAPSGQIMRLNVLYSGVDPLPDTFRDGSQALADGRMRPDGTFEASKIQAKCASKYEGKPQYKVPATQTTNRAAL